VQQERLGDRKADCLGGLYVDRQMIFGRELHRQVGYLGTAQNAVNIGRARRCCSEMSAL
jgi:hypothetical protein